MKRYLVMKMVNQLNQMAGFLALPGFYSLEAAENLVNDAHDRDPGTMYMIQEVGAA